MARTRTTPRHETVPEAVPDMLTLLEQYVRQFHAQNAR